LAHVALLPDLQSALLFLVPGILLILFGLIGYELALPGWTLGGVRFDVHTLLFSSLGVICGYQAITFAIFAKAFAINEGFLPEDKRITQFFELVNLERGIIEGVGSLLGDLVLLFAAVNQWRLTEFGRLEPTHTMRWVIPGARLTALGIQMSPTKTHVYWEKL